MAFGTIRNSIFWLRDFFEGSPVRKHYLEVREVNDDHLSDSNLRVRNENLERILRYCRQAVPYYRDMELPDEYPLQLENFPVVNKNMIRSQADRFISEEATKGKVFKATTSGSTGTPFTVHHDLNKKKRHQADVRYFWDTVGHPWGTRFYYLKIWNEKNRKSKRQQKKENIVPIDVMTLDEEAVSGLLDRMKSDKGPKSLLGYASALDQVAKYLRLHPGLMAGSNVLSVIAMSEALDGPTKEIFQKRFDCPVVSRYANIECGMLAQQTAALPEAFLANFASYHIEILHPEKDVKVPLGTLGRIVVTDLFNRAMPMVRYDTGDLGVMGKTDRDGKTQFVLKKVEGRKMDVIYDTQGETISSFTVTNSMWSYPELAQYQFIQKSAKTYEFRLNTENEFKREKELLQEFKSYLGEDAEIQVVYVSEIPLLSSGKRKKVVNLSNREKP